MWPLWEAVARRIWPTVDLPGSGHGLVSMHFGRYKGGALTLADGVHVRPGDPVGEIHVNSRVLVQALGPVRGPDKWPAVTIFRDELRTLARWVNRPDFPYELTAVYGVSILSRGALRLGFSVRRRDAGPMSWLDRIFLGGLLVLYGVEGRDRLGLGRTFREFPGEAWMSKEELLRRYASSCFR